ncbi:uncharacterized protein LOC144917963 [Branchiostoma floridae x Branchiostoma belcheri]
MEFCAVPNCGNDTSGEDQKAGNDTGAHLAQKTGETSNTGGIVAGAVVAILVLVAAVLGVAYYFLFWRKRMDDEKSLVGNEGPVATEAVGFRDILARNDKTETFSNVLTISGQSDA